MRWSKHACRTVLSLVWALIICDAFASVARATGENSAVLDTVVEAPFEPDDVFILFDFGDGQPHKARGVFAPLNPSSSAAGPKRYLVGARILLPRIPITVQFAAIVVGKDVRQQRAFAPVRRRTIGPDDLSSYSTEAIRQELLKRKEELRSWDIQVREQDESLRRLRSDAEVIGDFGRILDAREEMERLQEESDSLKKDQETLDRFLRLAKSRASPKNFSRRELQLQQQLALLAEAAKKAEKEEFSKRAEGEGELQRKLRTIEAMRGIDVDSLQRELAEIKAKRIALEKQESPLP